MAVLPAGDVTFLFTDVVGSTVHFKEHPELWPQVMAEHDRVLGEVIERHGGVLVKTIGDAVLAAFVDPSEAVAAAVAAQRVLATHIWPGDLRPSIRVGIHRGEATPDEGDYRSVCVHLAARVVSAANGGQVLLSDTVQIAAVTPSGCELVPCAPVFLRDFDGPQTLWAVEGSGLIGAATPPRAPGVLDTAGISRVEFIGRDEEQRQVEKALAAGRLVSIVGPGGAGKTRLALEVVEALAPTVRGGAWLIQLGEITSEADVVAHVAHSLRLATTTDTSAREALMEHVRRAGGLLLFDCCERLLDTVAALVDVLLAAAPDLRVLTTSREALRLAGEEVVTLGPLELPSDEQLERLGERAWDEVPALRLFAERARRARPTITLGAEDLDAAAEVIRAVDGLPLGVELAAARLQILAPRQLADRLRERTDVLRSTERGTPARHRDLQALVDWSADLLDPEARELLEVLGAFGGPAQLRAIAQVATGDPNADILGGLERLSAASLITVDANGEISLLDTTRTWAVGALSARDDHEHVRNRHLDLVLGYATADPRGAVADLSNLRSALRWAAAVDPAKGCRLLAATAEDLIAVGAGQHLVELAPACAAPGTGAPSRERAQVHLALAQMGMLGLDAALINHATEEAIVVAEEVGAHDLVALSLVLAAGACQLDARQEEIPGILSQAREAAERSGRREILSEVDFNAAIIEPLDDKEKEDRLRSLLDAPLPESVRHELSRELASALRKLDRNEEAAVLLDAILDDRSGSVPAHILMDAQVERARMHASFGQFDEADDLLAMTTSLARRTGAAARLAAVADARAAFALARADEEGWRNWSDEVLQFCEHTARYSLELLHLSRAVALTEFASVQEVRAELDRAATAAPESSRSSPFDEAFARAWIAAATASAPVDVRAAYERAAAIAKDNDSALDLQIVTAAFVRTGVDRTDAVRWLKRAADAGPRLTRALVDAAAVAVASADAALAARLVAAADAYPPRYATRRFPREEALVAPIRTPGVHATQEDAPALITFPEAGETVRQLDPLHSDFAMDIPAEPLFAVNVFSFIASVEPRSGGTLVIRNSHRVVQQYLDGLPERFPRTKAATQFAVDNSWLVSMAQQATVGATHDCAGIEVQLEELTGEPGDVVITHPWTLHAGASSAGTSPRIMLRHHVHRTAEERARPLGVPISRLTAKQVHDFNAAEVFRPLNRRLPRPLRTRRASPDHQRS